MKNFLFLTLMLGLLCYSCEDNGDDSNNPSKDPDKPSEHQDPSPTSLINTQWKLLSFNDLTGELTEFEPKNCDKCYTLVFGTDNTFTTYSSSNIFNGNYTADYDTNGFQVSDFKGTNLNEIGDGYAWKTFFPTLESFSLQENELKLYYENKKRYLRFVCIPSYNQNKPVEPVSFSPLTGGVSTKVTLTGENFGNDPSAVKVYFNQKQAKVLSCGNGKILAVTPRQPGSECVISVVVGKDSVWYDQKFTYITGQVVTTLVGKPGTNVFNPRFFDIDLATFVGNGSGGSYRGIRYLTVDDNYNLFLCHQDNPNAIILIDQTNNIVRPLLNPTGNRPNAPIIMDKGVVWVPADGSADWKDVFWEFDPAEQWMPKKNYILHPTKEQLDELGIVDFYLNEYKHSLAYCSYDGMVYYRSNQNGTLIKFDPVTLLGQSVVIDNEGQVIKPPGNSDSFLIFDPHNPTRLFVVCSQANCIYSFDIVTGEKNIYAGKLGQSGWQDGKVEDAMFRSPHQIVLDTDNNLLIADSENHCIRKINIKTGMVETIAGVPEQKGYQDGSPNEALFNSPWGVAVDKDGTIYIVDSGNQCIRKLTSD